MYQTWSPARWRNEKLEEPSNCQSVVIVDRVFFLVVDDLVDSSDSFGTRLRRRRLTTELATCKRLPQRLRNNPIQGRCDQGRAHIFTGRSIRNSTLSCRGRHERHPRSTLDANSLLNAAALGIAQRRVWRFCGSESFTKRCRSGNVVTSLACWWYDAIVCSGRFRRTSTGYRCCAILDSVRC
jgi:hypothetical protein